MKFKVIFFFAFLVFVSCKKDVETQGIHPDSLVIAIHDSAFEKALSQYDSDKKINGQILYGDVKNVDSLVLKSSYQINSKDGTANQVTSPVSLKGISFFTNLKYLVVDTSLMTELDVSVNINLEYLDCSGFYAPESVRKSLNTLIVGDQSSISTLICSYTFLTKIPVGSLPELKTLDCSASSVTGLDLSRNPKLEILSTSLSEVKNLDLTRNLKIKNLKCMGIASLDLSNNGDLEFLNAWNYGSPKLDLCNNKKLTELYVGGEAVEQVLIPAGLTLEKINQNAPNAVITRCP